MRNLLGTKTALGIAALYSLALLAVSLIKINTNKVPLSFNGADKVFHIAAYFGLTLLWQYVYAKRSKMRKFKPNLWICAGLIIFGIVVELLQMILTSYRSFEGLDMMANAAGVILAFFLLLWIKKRSRTRGAS